MEVVRVDGEPVALRLNGHQFACEEFGQTIVPKVCLTGLRLSDIPADVTIKPVESIDKDGMIHIHHNIELSPFREGSASSLVEEMFRRKLWDGDVGLSPYIAALRQAVDEHVQATESDFQDDGDNVFFRYAITVTEDLGSDKPNRSIGRQCAGKNRAAGETTP